MSLAGISGIGVISALGRNAEETRKALYAEPSALPKPPTRFETGLKLPVFEIEVPDWPEVPGIPLRFLLTALEEALKNTESGFWITPESSLSLFFSTLSGCHRISALSAIVT